MKQHSHQRVRGHDMNGDRSLIQVSKLRSPDTLFPYQLLRLGLGGESDVSNSWHVLQITAASASGHSPVDAHQLQAQLYVLHSLGVRVYNSRILYTERPQNADNESFQQLYPALLIVSA
jgi:hypothetical protein